MKMIQQFRLKNTNIMYGKTKIFICKDNNNLGEKSAQTVTTEIKRLLRFKEEIRCVFAVGQSRGYQTRKELYEKVLPKKVNLVNFNAEDPENLPASILREKPGTLFVDEYSCPNAWLEEVTAK